MPLISLQIYNAAANGPVPGWTKIPSRNKGIYCTDGSADGQIMVAVDSTASTWISRDRGVNYVAATGGAIGGPACAISADGQTIATASGNNISVSRDSGLTWATRAPGGSIITLFMSDSGQYIVASYALSNGKIVVSSDYGATFVAKQTAVTTNLIWGAQVSGDGKYMYGFGSSMAIQRSADFGATWASVAGSTAYGCDGWSAASADGKVIVAISGSTKLYVSRDYGVTWNLSLAKAGLSQYGVWISADGTTIFYTDNTSDGLISRDSGLTWSGAGGIAAGAPPSGLRAGWVNTDGSEIRIYGWNYRPPAP